MAKEIILIADDDLVVTDLLPLAIKRKMPEFEFLIVRHKEEAIRTFIRNEDSIALILIDMLLPQNQEELSRLDRFKKEIENLQGKLDGETDPSKQQLLRNGIALILKLQDINLNLRGGAEFIQEISSPGKPFSLPTIYQTALPITEIEKSKVKSLHLPGTVSWIDKPYTTDELLGEIKKKLPKGK